MKTKIKEIKVENTKKIKKVELENIPSVGLFLLGAYNKGGKTSLIDAIMFVLGGDRYRPSSLRNSKENPMIEIKLSNGWTVKRKGKNSTLEVITDKGTKVGITELREFISLFALDYSKFANASEVEKTRMLLKVSGLGNTLSELDLKIDAGEQERLLIGREKRRKEAVYMESPFCENVGEELSASEIINEISEIARKNQHIHKSKQEVEDLKSRLEQCSVQTKIKNTQIKTRSDRISQLEAEISELQAKNKEDALTIKKWNEWASDKQKELNLQKLKASKLKEISDEHLKAKLAEIEETNNDIRSKKQINLQRENAHKEFLKFEKEYLEKTAEIEKLRKERISLLQNANIPLKDLSISDQGKVIFRGMQWDCMSGAERIQVASAIVSMENENCGFILLDNLEAMDSKTIKEIDQWLIDNNLQGIGTAVTGTHDCNFYIGEENVVDINTIFNIEPQPKEQPAEPIDFDESSFMTKGINHGC